MEIEKILERMIPTDRYIQMRFVEDDIMAGTGYARIFGILPVSWVTKERNLKNGRWFVYSSVSNYPTG